MKLKELWKALNFYPDSMCVNFIDEKTEEQYKCVEFTDKNQMRDFIYAFLENTIDRLIITDSRGLSFDLYTPPAMVANKDFGGTLVENHTGESFIVTADEARAMSENFENLKFKICDIIVNAARDGKRCAYLQSTKQEIADKDSVYNKAVEWVKELGYSVTSGMDGHSWCYTISW